ncbi:uncharacterized protein LOC116177636 [Photinus pyralis]|uniref:uncharacterized protein LOC116177636 n=1 Tax=Photinus pyralis TaxID=7054 RepID=UPI001266F639|nr:uncharacterized protein LOC116177636 [Photinus pyralis]
MFNNKTYKMEDGLPMGNPISGLLANIFIDHLELRIKNLPNFKHVTTWLRYVDDIFVIWTGTIEQLHHFHTTINNISDIKFTLETESNNTLNFLDITLYNNNNHISYNIYRKPTTTDVIIPYNSYHSPNIKMAAFNFLFNRLLNTPLNPLDFHNEYNTILQIAQNNNYKPTLINNIFKRIKYKHLLKNIYPHHKYSNKYITIPYYKHIHTHLQKALNPYNITLTNTTHPTLQKILTNYKPKEPHYLQSGIYKITCNDCNCIYIGQTTRKFLTRFTEHNKNKPHSAIGTHINNTKHTISIDNTKILHKTNNYKKLTILEHYEIHKALQDPNFKLINDITEFNDNHLYKYVAHSHNTPLPHT